MKRAPGEGRLGRSATVADAIGPVGPLGAPEIADAAAAIEKMVAGGELWITVDLRRVTELDAVGLAFLKGVRRRLEARGGRLLLRGAAPAVGHMLDLCGIEHRAAADHDRSELSRALRVATSAGARR